MPASSVAKASSQLLIGSSLETDICRNVYIFIHLEGTTFVDENRFLTINASEQF